MNKKMLKHAVWLLGEVRILVNEEASKEESVYSRNRDDVSDENMLRLQNIDHLLTALDGLKTAINEIEQALA